MYNKENPIYDVEKEKKIDESKFNNQYNKILSDSIKNAPNHFEINGNTTMNNKKEINKTKKLTKRGKKAIKKSLKAAGTIALMLIGGKAVIGMKNEYDYQNDIDESIIDDYDAYYEDMSNKDKQELFKYDISKEDFVDYLSAVEVVKKYDGKILNYNSEEYDKLDDAKNIVEKYTKNGDAVKFACNTVQAKIDNAVKYGEYEYDKNENLKVNYQINYEDDFKGFIIDGVSGEKYDLDEITLLGVPIIQDIPGNLNDLTEKIFEYRGANFENREECIEAGVELGTQIGEVMQEYYTLDKDGNLERINQQENSKRILSYREKQAKEEQELHDRIYEKYGISVEPVNDEEHEI